MSSGSVTTARTETRPAAAPSIPLCAGLTIVTAVNDVDGDYESIKTIQAVSDSEVRLNYSTERMVMDELADDKPHLQRTNPPQFAQSPDRFFELRAPGVDRGIGQRKIRAHRYRRVRRQVQVLRADEVVAAEGSPLVGEQVHLEPGDPRRNIGPHRLSVARGALKPDEITEDRISAALQTGGLPQLDLLVRTSGEERLSNFLLWEAAYAELWFTDRMWPEFGAGDLNAALAEFAVRNRTFGMVPDDPRPAVAVPA